MVGVPVMVQFALRVSPGGSSQGFWPEARLSISSAERVLFQMSNSSMIPLKWPREP